MMKKIFGLSALGLALLNASLATAAPISLGNVVIYRVGNGTETLVNTGNTVFVDEYSQTGSLVQSIQMPTTVSGANKQLIASGTATSEGLLTVSPNGQYIALTGYSRDLGGSGSIGGTTAATVNRTVGIVNVGTGAVDTSTAMTDYADGNNPRSAVTTNGTDIWVAGGAGGARYTTLGSTTSTQLSTTVSNLRQINVFDGQLYTSTSSGSAVRIGAIGTGTPTTSGQTITNLTGIPTSGSPYAFFLADLDVGVSGLDTMYVAADDAAALTKYSLVGGSWVSNGVIGLAADAYRGITGLVDDNGDVSLFAIRKGGSNASGGGELVGLVDASGYNSAFTGTPSLLATATAGTSFRGIGIVPVPEPSTIVLGAMGLVGLIGFRMQSRRKS